MPDFRNGRLFEHVRFYHIRRLLISYGFYWRGCGFGCSSCPMAMSALAFAFCLLLSPRPAAAYPEYSARYNVIRCTACHISPVGGGPKTVDGKLFGAHGYKLNPFLAQDYVSADLRVLHYVPQRPTDSKGGSGIMVGAIAVHAPLDADKHVHLLIDHNIAGFSAGSASFRETYALYKWGDDVEPRWFETLLVGRFRAPFGIVTDEHRTYTRIQTATEFFTYETGVLLSGTPSNRVHYDLGLVNGEKNPGQALSAGGAQRWGGLLNVRHMFGPVMGGLSASHHDHADNRESRQAGSLYAIVSVGRITHNRVPLSIRLEHARARNWGSRLSQGFVSDPAYGGTLGAVTSQAWLAWFDYALSEKFTLTYKYDFLMPDQEFPSDVYERHGLGVRWAIAPLTIVQLRTEFARATHPTERGSIAAGGQNATFAVLQLSL